MLICSLCCDLDYSSPPFPPARSRAEGEVSFYSDYFATLSLDCLSSFFWRWPGVKPIIVPNSIILNILPPSPARRGAEGEVSFYSDYFATLSLDCLSSFFWRWPGVKPIIDPNSIILNILPPSPARRGVGGEVYHLLLSFQFSYPYEFIGCHL